MTRVFLLFGNQLLQPQPPPFLPKSVPFLVMQNTRAARIGQPHPVKMLEENKPLPVPKMSRIMRIQR